MEGNLAELGVWKGNSSAVLAFYAKKTNRKCFLLDTFEGFNKNDLKGYDKQFEEGHFSDTSIQTVKDIIGPELIDVCEFIPGYFPESINNSIESSKFSIVSLDADLYEPTKAGLEWFFPRMYDGGIFLLHDYSSRGWDGCKRAIDEFCDKENQKVVLMPDKSGSAFVRVNKP